jgi:hypothetical protein
MLTDSIPKDLEEDLNKDPTADQNNSPMDVTTMDNAPGDASKIKDVGEVSEKQDKGEVVETEETANKTPDDGNTTQIPNMVEVNNTEEIADNTPADVDVNKKPEEGRVARPLVVKRLKLQRK